MTFISDDHKILHTMYQVQRVCFIHLEVNTTKEHGKHFSAKYLDRKCHESNLNILWIKKGD